MKRFSLITLFFLTLTLSAFAAVTFSADEYPTLTFTILTDSTVSVTGSTSTAGLVTIPSCVTNPATHKTYTVTDIKTSAFRENENITGVKLNEGLQTIGASAFYKCTNLGGEISIPSTVTQIGNYAFYVCGAITKIVFNEGDVNLSIGKAAFNTPTMNNNIGDLVLPSHINYIGNNAFSNQNFPSVTLEATTPPELEFSFNEASGKITCGVFSGSTCTINLPCGTYFTYTQDTVWNVYKTRLSDGIAGREHTLENGVIVVLLSDSTAQVSGHTEEISGVIEIPSSVNLQSSTNSCTHKVAIISIQTSAFRETASITGIILNEGLQTIGASAFYNCTNLGGEINIPSTVTQIGNYAFYVCGAITKIVFNEGDANLSIGLSAFNTPTANNSIGDLVLPSHINYIGRNAFINQNFPSVTVEATTPPELGFDELKGAKSCGVFSGSACTINLPCGTYFTYTQDTVWNVYKTRLSDGIAGREYTLENGVIIELLTDSTAQVSGHTEEISGVIEIPSSVNLQSSTNSCTHDYAIISVKTSAMRETASITGVKLNEGLQTIGASAFYKCTNLGGEISIPSTVTQIGNYAFALCGNFSRIAFNNGTNDLTIGLSAFSSSESNSTIDELTIPATITSIGASAFNKQVFPCIRMESATPAKLGGHIFSGSTCTIYIPCGSYANYTQDSIWNTYYRNRLNDGFPLNTTHIADHLKVKIISDSTVQVIGHDGIEGGNLIIPSVVTILREECSKDFNVVSIASGAFRDSINIYNLTLSEGLRYIGGSAFARCTNLSCDLKIPSSVDSIGDYAFFNCKSFNSLMLPEGLRTIGKYCFYTDIQQDKFSIPSTMQTIGDRAFARLLCNYIIVNSLTPPIASETDANIFSNATKSIVIPCGAMGSYTNAYYWKDLSSKFVSACKPLTLKKGEALTQEDTIVSSIAYRRTFDMDVWQTLYLPFDVNSVLVYDDEDAEYYDINYPFVPGTGGYFYLNEYDTTNVEEATITFTTATRIEKNTPYLIQFPTTDDGYFVGKDIVFKSKPGEYTLKKSDYSQPKATTQFQVSGNSSVYNQSVSDMYIFRTTLLQTVDGKDSIKYEFNQQASDTLKPFEFGLLPYVVEPSSGISSAPMRMSLRIGRSSGNTGGGDITTSVSETHASNAITYRTGAGELALSLNGLPCQLYSVSGTLLYSSAGGTEEITIPLEKGIYILYSEGKSQKIVL